MMDLITGLKTNKLDRVCSFDMRRWMFWSDEESSWEKDKWVVMEKRGSHGGAKTLIVTADLEEAVKVLIGEEPRPLR